MVPIYGYEHPQLGLNILFALQEIEAQLFDGGTEVLLVSAAQYFSAAPFP